MLAGHTQLSGSTRPPESARDRRRAVAQSDQERPTVLCLSGTFSTDRILVHSGFLDYLGRVAKPVVWSHGPRFSGFRDDGDAVGAFATFPVLPPERYRLTVLRHFDNYVWDQSRGTRSRENFWALRRRQHVPGRQRVLRALARPVAALGAGALVERAVEFALLRSCPRAAFEAVRSARPSLVLAMNPWRPEQMQLIAAARRLSVPIAMFVTSWDNPTTKGRLPIRNDAYIAWSDSMAGELRSMDIAPAGAPVYVVGAPQFDVFHDKRFHVERSDFLRRVGLQVARPVVLYALGSPNLLREEFGLRLLCEHLRATRRLSNVQILVRPHPQFRGYSILEELARDFPQVVIQRGLPDRQAVAYQTADQIVEWVNTVRHADVVVTLSSTMAIDAAICDRPVVNLDFDPEPGQPNAALVAAINHEWEHFKPVAESGGMQLVQNVEEMTDAIERYLADPALDRAARAAMVRHVCGPCDGQAAERMAAAVADLIPRYVRSPIRSRAASASR